MVHDWDQSLDDLEKTVARALGDISRQSVSFDGIAVPGDVSGVVVGSPLSIALQKPLVIVRTHPNRCACHRKHVIGDVQGKKFLYVDDQISSGTTFRLVEDGVRSNGGMIVATYEYQFTDFRVR